MCTYRTGLEGLSLHVLNWPGCSHTPLLFASGHSHGVLQPDLHVPGFTVLQYMAWLCEDSILDLQPDHAWHSIHV